MTGSFPLTINGQTHQVSMPSFATLADVLRGVGLVGTKIGCGTGDCGACTVHCDGRPVMACQLLASEVRGAITTIEGLNDADAVALRRAFAEQGAFQCGFCTSGQIMQAHSLLSQAARMDDRMLTRALSGNICRCTGYAGIVRAIRAVSAECVHGTP